MIENNYNYKITNLLPISSLSVVPDSRYSK